MKSKLLESLSLEIHQNQSRFYSWRKLTGLGVTIVGFGTTLGIVNLNLQIGETVKGSKSVMLLRLVTAVIEITVLYINIGQNQLSRLLIH